MRPQVSERLLISDGFGVGRNTIEVNNFDLQKKKSSVVCKLQTTETDGVRW